jgi:hypothetical protein
LAAADGRGLGRFAPRVHVPTLRSAAAEPKSYAAMRNIVVTSSMRSLDGSLVALGIGHDGAVYAAFALNRDDTSIERPDGAKFFKTRPDEPQVYRLFSWESGRVTADILIRGEPFNITEVQPLGADLLLVCPRCRRNPGGDPERNARLYGRDGVLKSEFTLGDGIASVQTTEQGLIWVSYFDEGIFGNYGWSEPLGGSGLVAWSSSGTKLYEYTPPAGHEPISDCYALNVTRDRDVWCYYYTDFSMARIRNFVASDAWRMPVKGAHALALDGRTALLFGSYETRDQLHLVRLHARGTTEVVASFGLVLPSGEPLTVDRVAARDSRVLFASGNHIYETSVQACRSAA